MDGGGTRGPPSGPARLIGIAASSQYQTYVIWLVHVRTYILLIYG